MTELLLELFSEEIPARMQARAADELKESLIHLAHSECGFVKEVNDEDVRTFVTPRRLVGWIRDLPLRQRDTVIERKGPRVGAPEQAVQGFLKSVGLTALDQCEIRTIGNAEFYFAVRQQRGRATAEVLKEKLPDLILGFSWPKSMRWANTAARWVRPLQSVLCIFNGRALGGKVGLASTDLETPGISFAFGDKTRGHRFLSPKAFAVKSFADYKKKLLAASVMLDRDERKRAIAAGAAKLAAAEGLAVKDDPRLLEELSGLVEWPVPLLGSIDRRFMDLPREVLATTMRANQKYLALETTDGKLAPRFVVVANMRAKDGGKAIVAGNERVLRARLSDARFFWDHDRKLKLEARVPRLKDLVFHAKLGSVGDKVARLQALAAELAAFVPGAPVERVRRAALLAKADLVTGMVGEFPELQGIMGRYYALDEGEQPAVADAIAEHYAPLGPADRCPTAPVSVALALADKLDTLVGFWLIDEKPTGSKDPYALRRAALGVIRLIIENNLRLPLIEAFELAHRLYRERQAGAGNAAPFDAGGLLAFFADRLRVHLREKGVRHDLVSAVFALGDEDDLVRLLARVAALAKFLDSEDGANLLTAYKRASNIVRIEEKKDKIGYDGGADAGLLAESEERALYEGLGGAAGAIRNLVGKEDFAGAMAALARLRRPVDAFFDKVTVNCEDKKLRENRLKLLSGIRSALGGVADFSKIEG